MNSNNKGFNYYINKIKELLYEAELEHNPNIINEIRNGYLDDLTREYMEIKTELERIRIYIKKQEEDF